jgi:hypothetical protein
MIAIVFIILLFAGTVIMLMTLTSQVSQDDYKNFYVHNLLLTVMRSDTGYTDSQCKLVSDAIGCAFSNPDKPCGAGAPTCLEVAQNATQYYIELFSGVKSSYRYLFTVESRGFVAEHNGEPFRISIGDSSIADLRQTKYTANEEIPINTRNGNFNLNAKLTLVSKKA